MNVHCSYLRGERCCFDTTQGAVEFWLTREAANFWLFVMSVTVMCLAVDWAFKGFKRNLFPEPFHVIQNRYLASSSITATKEMLNAAEDSHSGLVSQESLGMPLTPKGTSNCSN